MLRLRTETQDSAEAIFAAFPYLLSGLLLQFRNAIFEHRYPKLAVLGIDGWQIRNIGKNADELAISTKENNDVAIDQRIAALEVKCFTLCGISFHKIKGCCFFIIGVISYRHFP